jgi:hypothetical protein
MSARVEQRMTGLEVLSEVQWLLEANLHPLFIARQLNRKPDSIATLARRYAMPELAATFAQAAAQDLNKDKEKI